MQCRELQRTYFNDGAALGNYTRVDWLASLKLLKAEAITSFLRP